MRQAVLALVMLGVATVAFAEDDKADKDLKQLEGTWKYVAQTTKGKAASKEDLAGTTLTVTAGGKWSVKKDGNEVLAGTVKLDSSKSPKTADWTITTKGKFKDKKALAIYKLDKDKFEHCFSMDKRPEKFESKEDSDVTHSTLERVKK